MVAETSAWGRALAALGLEVKRGVASREEVAARKGSKTNNAALLTTPAPAKQRKAVEARLKSSDLSDDAKKAIWRWGQHEGHLARPRASEILDALNEPDGIAALLGKAGYSELPLDDEGLVPDESVPADDTVPSLIGGLVVST